MKAPAFQLYAADFMADPLVDAMTPEELGGYFRLLLVAWQQEEPGFLPNDETLLSAWSRLRDRWAACRAAIMRCFREDTLGRLYQKRMVSVAADQAVYREKQRQKGLASAAARERNRNSTAVQLRLTSGSTPVDERYQPEGNSPSPSPTPPETKRSKKELPHPPSASAGEFSVDSPGTSRETQQPKKSSLKFDFDAIYAAYPRKIGRKRGLQLCVSRVKTAEQYSDLERAVRNYARTATSSEERFVKHFDTFMGCWEDYVDEKVIAATVSSKISKPYLGPRSPVEAISGPGGKEVL